MIRLVDLLGRGCLVGALAGAVVACDPYGAYCEEMMDCLDGNESDVEACVVEMEAAAEQASLWDCDEWFDELFACVEDESDCDNDHYTPGDDCEDEQEDFSACM